VALDEGDRRELVDGELVEVEVPTDVHEYIVSLLGYFLTAWARPRRAGFALASGFKVRISAERGVMPDLQFYRTGNRSAVRTRQGLVQGCPDVAVEIVSESSVRHDRVTKLAYYASIGVPEYWIVDPKLAHIEQYGIGEAEYVLNQRFDRASTLTTPSFPEVAIDMSWVFRG